MFDFKFNRFSNQHADIGGTDASRPELMMLQQPHPPEILNPEESAADKDMADDDYDSLLFKPAVDASKPQPQYPMPVAS